MGDNKSGKEKENRRDRAQRYEGINAGMLDTWYQDDLAKTKETRFIARGRTQLQDKQGAGSGGSENVKQREVQNKTGSSRYNVNTSNHSRRAAAGSRSLKDVK